MVFVDVVYVVVFVCLFVFNLILPGFKIFLLVLMCSLFESCCCFCMFYFGFVVVEWIFIYFHSFLNFWSSIFF